MRAKSKKSGEKFRFGSPVSFSKELDGGSGASAVWRAERKTAAAEQKQKKEGKNPKKQVFLQAPNYAKA